MHSLCVCVCNTLQRTDIFRPLPILQTQKDQMYTHTHTHTHTNAGTVPSRTQQTPTQSVDPDVTKDKKVVSGVSS